MHKQREGDDICIHQFCTGKLHFLALKKAILQHCCGVRRIMKVVLCLYATKLPLLEMFWGWKGQLSFAVLPSV